MEHEQPENTDMNIKTVIVVLLLCTPVALADIQYGDSAPYTTVEPPLEYPISDTDRVGGQGPVLIPASIQILTYGIHDDPTEYEDANGDPYGLMAYFTPELLNLENDMFWMSGNVARVIYQVAQKGYNVTIDGVVTLRDGTRWQIEMSDITEFISLRKL
jgi:hypothetical protein